MKCPKCGGNAELSNWGSYTDPDYADFHVECEKCGYHSMGSTDPQKAKEMFENGMGKCYTNEEWLKSLSTEELANYIATQCADAIRLWREMQYWTAHEKCKSNKWYVWLKEVHNADRS